MALRVALVAGLLVMVESQASDTEGGSNTQGFLSKHLISEADSSKNSFGRPDKFIIPNLMYIRQGNGPAALAHHNNPAVPGPIIGDTQRQDMNSVGFTSPREEPVIGTMGRAIPFFGVGLLSLVAMLRIRRWLQPASALASSGGLGSDMSFNLAPVLGENLMEMKSQASDISDARALETRLHPPGKRSVSFSSATDILADIIGPLNFDPLGLNENISVSRGSELSHGRIGMLAVFFTAPMCRNSSLHPLQAASIAEQVGKLRLDALLLQRGFAASRSQATALIREGAVAVEGETKAKPSTKVFADASITVASEKNVRYVSRGGEKLHAAFEAWPEIVPDGRTVLDIGASTGGFSHCSLLHGAAAVDGVDVGSGQFHASLLEDDRVRSFENVNCRYDEELEAIPLLEAYDLVVTDCSFISLTKLLPAIWKKLAAGGDLICLVKPQFECGPDIVRRGRGVVRDPADRQSAVDAVVAFAREKLPACEVVDDVVESPVHDKLGNREFLLRLRRRSTSQVASLEAAAAAPAAYNNIVKAPLLAAALTAAAPGIAAAADTSSSDQAGVFVGYAYFLISVVAGIKGVADKLRNDKD